MTHGSTRPSVRPTKFFREQSSDHTTVRCCSNVVAKSFYMPFTDRCDLTAKSLGYLRCIKLKPSYQEALVKQLNQNTFISTKPVRSQSKIQEKHLQDLILTSVHHGLTERQKGLTIPALLAMTVWNWPSETLMVVMSL